MSNPPNYSLWLMPDKRVSDLIKQEIANESESYGGPSFEPHITLLPDIKGDLDQIKETCHTLVKQLKVRLARSQHSSSTLPRVGSTEASVVTH